MNNNYTQSFGKTGEDEAVKFLLSKEFSILKRNYHSPYGEIDIIALKQDTIHFVEVKARANNYQSALSSVSRSKQKKIYKTAQHFLSKNPQFHEHFTQFDVVAIYLQNNQLSITYLDDAFRYIF